MIIKKLFLSKLEISSIGLKAWLVVGNATTFLIAAGVLSTSTRGYFFTFFSLASIQIVFESGFNYTLMQSFAQKGIEYNLILINSNKEMAIIFRNGFYRMIKMSTLYFVSSIILGFFIFSRNLNINYLHEIMLPWIFFVLIISLKLIFMVFEAFFEGIGEIYFLTNTRLLGSIISSSILWIFLFTPHPLYGLGLSILGYLLTSSLIYYCKYINIINIFLGYLKCKSSNHKNKDGNAYQNKIAISWISGFIAFQSYSIFELYLNGPVSAGILGVAVAISTLILSFASVWVYTKNSKINQATAKGNYVELKFIFDDLRNKTILSSILLSLMIVLSYYLEPVFFNFFKAMPSLYIILIFILGSILTSYIGLIAAFVRAQNLEPFFYPSILHAILTFFLLILLVKPYPVLGASLAFIIPIVLISLPSSLIIKKAYFNQ